MVDEDESVDLSFGLKGKVTVVTGGAAGIGAAIARAFVAKGARVALVDRDIDTARAHARNLGENVRAFQCDVADPSSAENAVRSVLTEFGHMDVLANCAGMVVLAPAEDLTSQMWDTTLAVNLTGTFLMSQQNGRAMLEAGGGKIINIASQAASIGLDQHAAYCASKAGVRGPAPGGRGASRWVLPDGQRGLSAAAPGARRPHRGHRRLAACPETWPLCRWLSAAARGAGQIVGAENLCHQAILVDDATRAVMPPDPEMIQVGNAIWQRPQWRGLVQRAMRPVGIVEVLVLPQHHHQVAQVPDQGPVQQLMPAAANPPLRDRIHSRCLNGGADDPAPGRLEYGIERLREAGVPVMQDELRSRPGISQVHEQVPGLLDDPGLDRVLRGAQDPDAPAAVLDHCKDVHLRAIEQVSGEEVQRQDRLRLGPQELRPARAAPARRRVDPGVFEDLPDR